MYNKRFDLNCFMFNVSLICNLIFCMSEPKISGLSKSILWSVTNECLYTEQYSLVLCSCKRLCNLLVVRPM